MSKWVLLISIICSSYITHAQLLLGVGGQADFPMMFNSYVGGYNHQTGNPGFRITGTYLSPQSNFSAAASVSISTASLPVQWVQNEFVLSMDFIHLQAMFYARLKKEMPIGQFFYGLGIGISHFSGDGVTIGGNNDIDIHYVLSDSSKYIKELAPTIALNGEYIRPISDNGKLYVGIGGQLNYFFFYDKSTTYRIDIIDNKNRYFKTQPNLYGHIFNPMLFLNLYYRLGKSNRRY